MCADVVVMCAPVEAAEGKVVVKNMRTGEQQSVAVEEVVAAVTHLISSLPSLSVKSD